MSGDGNRWFPSGPFAHGVALVTHGLNNRPEIMDPLIGVLIESGVHARRVALAGHEGGPARHTPRIERLWLQDVAAALDECRRRCPQLPIYNLAFSLGGLITVRYLEDDPGAFARMVLLAPAIRFTAKARLLRPVAGLARWRLSLPSLAPPELRAHRRTPLAAYQGMFRLADSVGQLEHGSVMARTPTRVLVSPADELVSYRGLRRWIETNHLRSWTVLPVSVASPASYAHLLVSPSALGRRAWESVASQVVEFLAPPPELRRQAPAGRPDRPKPARRPSGLPA